MGGEFRSTSTFVQRLQLGCSTIVARASGWFTRALVAVSPTLDAVSVAETPIYRGHQRYCISACIRDATRQYSCCG